MISTLEHNSNYLPWYEINKELPNSTLVILKIDEFHRIDQVFFEEQLQKYASRNIFVSLTACSNITGTIQDTFILSKLCHKYNGKIFFDMATSAPYLPINMHLDNNSYYDGIFLSPHKIPGGVGSPGNVQLLFTM